MPKYTFEIDSTICVITPSILGETVLLIKRQKDDSDHYLTVCKLPKEMIFVGQTDDSSSIPSERAEDAPASTEATKPSVDPEQLQRTAIEASRPRYLNGGVFVPALGIILDLNPLSESAKWDEAMNIAKANGKRLPTIDEWHYIYYHRDDINAIIKEHGGTELNSYHWSSTELSATHSWFVSFSNGHFNYFSKYHSLVVRAVAAFNS